jgi:hypothetical protein
MDLEMDTGEILDFAALAAPNDVKRTSGHYAALPPPAMSQPASISSDFTRVQGFE